MNRNYVLRYLIALLLAALLSGTACDRPTEPAQQARPALPPTDISDESIGQSRAQTYRQTTTSPLDVRDELMVLIACKLALDAALDDLPAKTRNMTYQAQGHLDAERIAAQERFEASRAMEQYGNRSVGQLQESLDASTALSNIEAQQSRALRGAQAELNRAKEDAFFYYGPCQDAVLALGKHIEGKAVLSPMDKQHISAIFEDPRFREVVRTYAPDSIAKLQAIRVKYLR